jgi:hypothetical protein
VGENARAQSAANAPTINLSQRHGKVKSHPANYLTSRRADLSHTLLKRDVGSIEVVGSGGLCSYCAMMSPVCEFPFLHDFRRGAAQRE